MKDKLAPSKHYLVEALRRLPATENMAQVRYHLRQALLQMESVEKRKSVVEQPTSYQSWNDMLKNGIVNPNPQYTRRTLAVIDQMIQAERQKLDSLQKGSDDRQEDESLQNLLD